MVNKQKAAGVTWGPHWMKSAVWTFSLLANKLVICEKLPESQDTKKQTAWGSSLRWFTSARGFSPSITPLAISFRRQFRSYWKGRWQIHPCYSFVSLMVAAFVFSPSAALRSQIWVTWHSPNAFHHLFPTSDCWSRLLPPAKSRMFQLNVASSWFNIRMAVCVIKCCINPMSKR